MPQNKKVYQNKRLMATTMVVLVAVMARVVVVPVVVVGGDNEDSKGCDSGGHVVRVAVMARVMTGLATILMVSVTVMIR